MTAPDPEIIIGIPGKWESRQTIIEAIVRANPNPADPSYLAIGNILSSVRDGTTFGFEIYDSDPHLSEVFGWFKSRLTDAELQAITEHTFTIYLIGSEQTLEMARAMLQAASFLLDAGGLGVKIECSGACHGKARWQHFADQPDLTKIYEAFTSLTSDENRFTTSGMHQFGIPDASLLEESDFEIANEQLATFNIWQLSERSAIQENDLFVTSFHDPAFTLNHEPYGYEIDSCLNNPHGLWVLNSNNSEWQNNLPLATEGEPIFIAMPSNDPEVLSSIEDARRTFSYFSDHFNNHMESGFYMFKSAVDDGGNIAHLWASVEKIDDNHCYGNYFELPDELRESCPDGMFRIHRDELEDWAIIKNCALIGGFSLRLHREKVDRNEVLRLDLHSGTISYLPLEDITGF